MREGDLNLYQYTCEWALSDGGKLKDRPCSPIRPPPHPTLFHTKDEDGARLDHRPAFGVAQASDDPRDEARPVTDIQATMRLTECVECRREL